MFSFFLAGIQKLISEASVCDFIKKETTALLKKDTLAQVFPCEFCEISENISSYRIPPVAASVIYPFNAMCMLMNDRLLSRTFFSINSIISFLKYYGQQTKILTLELHILKNKKKKNNKKGC